MILEKQIQDWLLEVVGNTTKAPNDPTRESRELKDVLSFGDHPLDIGLREALKSGKLIPYESHPSAHQACRILRSFIEVTLLHGERDVSFEPQAILRTDIVLLDAGYSDSFVIVEIKRSKSAAREAATELLAYANAFKTRNRHAQVFLVLISTSWKQVERGAFRELVRNGYPFLPLEYVEHPTSPTLLVRTDLLPARRDGFIHEDRLLLRSTVFPWPFPSRYRIQPEHINRVAHIVRALTNRAWSAGQSGFVLAWYSEITLQLFVTVASCSPYQVDMFAYDEISDDVTRSLEQEAAFKEKLVMAARANVDRYNDSFAYELLYGSDFGIKPEEEAGSEGNWPSFRKRLITDRAVVLSFEAFGDLGVHLDIWRTKHRNALAPAIPDVALLPTWHPTTWLPLLNSLLVSQENTGPFAAALEGFRAGEVVATFIQNQQHGRSVFHPMSFAWTSGQANFAAVWSQMSKTGSFDHLVQLKNGVLSAPIGTWHAVTESACAFFYNKDLLACYCFLLGLFSVNNQCSIEHLKQVRGEIDMQGVEFPPQLSEIEKAAMECGRHLRC